MKESKTISESRGQKVEDRAKAADFLLHNNHYRASGCSLTLRDHDVFFPNARFQNIMGIYESDRKLGTGTKSNQMSLADWMRKWIGTQKKARGCRGENRANARNLQDEPAVEHRDARQLKDEKEYCCYMV